MKFFAALGMILALGFLSVPGIRNFGIEKGSGSSGLEYFPLLNNYTLIYESDFGETKSEMSYENGYYLFKNDGDDFKYYQKLLINNDGVYILETYQKIHIFLFINSEGTFHYNKPLLRIPLPLEAGEEWDTKDLQIDDNDTTTVNLNGKVIGTDTVTTPAGKFNTIKIESTLITSHGTKNIITEWFAKNVGMVKMHLAIEGGGAMGIVRDLLGYGDISFVLKEIDPD
jgi:DUF3108-like